jgi:hypothetical protein
MVCFTTTTIVNSFKKVGFHTHDNAELEIATPPEITATNFEEYAKSNPPCTVLPNEKDILASILAEKADSRDVKPGYSDNDEVHFAVRPTSSDLSPLASLVIIAQDLKFGSTDY